MTPTLLITGGSGNLGRKLIPHLLKEGYSVRVSSRSDRKPNFFPEAEWVRATLETGEGLAEAVRGVDTIIHAASDVMNAKKIDAVYLLREVFDYEYAEIAKIVDKTEDNCHQVFSRAKHYITQRRPHFEPNPEQEHRLVEQFLETLNGGNMDDLLEILAQDIVVYSDGDGKAFAAKKPVVGIELVARFFFGIVKQAPPGLEVRFARSNGLPAIINFIDGVPHSVLAFQIFDGRIQNVFAVLNPDKLRNVRFYTTND